MYIYIYIFCKFISERPDFITFRFFSRVHHTYIVFVYIYIYHIIICYYLSPTTFIPEIPPDSPREPLGKRKCKRLPVTTPSCPQRTYNIEFTDIFFYFFRLTHSIRLSRKTTPVIYYTTFILYAMW